ncbi:uncharacterized protein [Watersipora subatra]|uniref:uncharacterized protein isoform X2 n=1 Tax=Watersipora subatra TaxID=2589382 RepID=UPI00355ADD16
MELKKVVSLHWLVFTFIVCQASTQDVPSILLLDSSGLSTIVSPANRLYGDGFKFKCAAPNIEDEQFAFTMELESLSDDDSWTTEGKCSFLSSGDQKPIGIPSSSLNITTDAITCDENYKFSEFTFSLPLTRQEAYRCNYGFWTAAAPSYSAVFTLKSHSKPDTPSIQLSNTPVNEGTSVTISCSSNGMPAPKLTIEFKGLAKAVSDDVTASSPDLLQNTFASWTIASADSSYHGFPVLCKVTDHPYGGVQSEVILNVTYGPKPDHDGPQEETYDKQSGVDLVLDGTMKGYPEPEYKWYFGNSNTTLATTAVLTVSQEEAKELSSSVQYRVIGKNPSTGVNAQLVYNVIITEISAKTAANDGVFTTTGGDNNPSESGSTGEKEGLKSWVIAIIVVVVVIVVAVMVGGIVLWRHRKGSSSVKKSKAAQAKQSGEDRNDTTNYQSSKSSLTHQDLSRRAASYHENPTLPMEYRYSQGNVEQYAEVIDDMPRSRKPIAVEEIDMFDAGEGPPTFDEAPPAYLDMHQYRGDPNYSTYSPNNYGDSYGAAC